MAIDLHKPIGAAPAASAALPTKRTMNLLVRERKSSGAWKYALAALALALLVAAFVKFAIIDVFGQVDVKKSELVGVQAERDALDKRLADYEALQDEYLSYTGVSITGASAPEVTDMVARVVQPKATVTAINVSDGMISVNVKDLTLDELGKLADDLRAEELVQSVTVTNANDDESGHVFATLVATLADDSNEGGE
ncbi:MAG: hypothetical protein IJ131_04015 [Eggerthellaceae bacterium]|nr:hypothetical protein [Eggerthellaceae bacterium]